MSKFFSTLFFLMSSTNPNFSYANDIDKEPTIRKNFESTFSKYTKGLDASTFATDITTFHTAIKLIFPGTKWCGTGNISESFSDLGTFSKTDSCCREHDICPEYIPARSEGYGLVNNGLYTRSNCDCDDKLYNCLKNTDTVIANTIGHTYFTILRPQCFKQDYPIIECNKIEKGQCVDYVQDTDGEKIYQWFDSPTF